MLGVLLNANRAWALSLSIIAGININYCATIMRLCQCYPKHLTTPGFKVPLYKSIPVIPAYHTTPGSRHTISHRFFVPEQATSTADLFCLIRTGNLYSIFILPN